MEKEKFEEFSRADGQQDLYDYCNRPRRNILEVLHDFRHTTPNIPVDYLFDLIPGASSTHHYSFERNFHWWAMTWIFLNSMSTWKWCPNRGLGLIPKSTETNPIPLNKKASVHLLHPVFGMWAKLSAFVDWTYWCSGITVPGISPTTWWCGLRDRSQTLIGTSHLNFESNLVIKTPLISAAKLMSKAPL